MGKINCEICGTIYPDTESRCPICGWSQGGIDFGDELAQIDEQMFQEEMNIEPSRQTASRKSGNREIFDFDAVNDSDFSEENGDFYDDELPEEDTEGGSNPILVVLLTIVIVALLATIGFIFFRFFLPGQNKQDETVPSESVQMSETTETTIPAVPCTGISLTSGMPTLSQEGQFWLLHVVVMPEDTTDSLNYTSMDESIVTVNEEGRVTAVAEGETTIVVTCGSQRIECPVTVNYTVEETTAPTTAETSAEGETQTVEEGQTEDQPQEEENQVTEETQAPTEAVAVDPNVVLKLKKKDITFSRSGVYVDLLLDCELTADQVEWSSANPNVASVKNGAVTAVGPGITTITVKYGDQTDTCIVRCIF